MDGNASTPALKLGEVRLNLHRYNNVVMVTMVLVFCVMMLLTYILQPFKVSKFVGIASSIVIMMVSAFIHEGLHGLAAMLTGVRRQSLHFEFSFSLFYCHPGRPMTLAHYRFFLLFPLAVMLPPLFLAWALTLHWVAAAAVAINIAGALVDVALYWKLRHFTADAVASIYRGEPGCDIHAGVPDYDRFNLMT